MSSVTLPFTPAISDAVLKTFAAWVETDAYGAHADARQESSQKIQTARHFIQYFMDAPDVGCRKPKPGHERGRVAIAFPAQGPPRYRRPWRSRGVAALE